jgi:hypothetical protein
VGLSWAAHRRAGKLSLGMAGLGIAATLLSFVPFFLGQAVLAGGRAPSANLGSPGALRAVALTGLLIALTAVMSFGLGLIVRSSAGAIGVVAGDRGRSVAAVSR